MSRRASASAVRVRPRLFRGEERAFGPGQANLLPEPDTAHNKLLARVQALF